FGLSMLVPLYFVERLGASKQAANLALAVMLTAGAIGTLIGGRLGDRIGVRNVLLGSLAVLSPLILWLGGSSSAVATILLVPIGGCTIATFAITVVMAQDYLPDHIGVASGFAYGLAMGLGGLAAAGLGVVVDAAGVRDALLAVALAPVIAVSIALTLPRHGAPLDEIGLSET
ncbi:MAG: MFS transporter, partial [Solirubrobacteraceae bacterium]